jgi:hypothetical protein
MYQFGSGVLLGVRTDIANATPINFGLVQDVALDLSFTTKMLYGQYQFPVAIARGTAKFTGKAKMARISGLAWGSLFFGVTPAAGQQATAFGEAGVVPTTPYQVTVSNSATFTDDYGVVNAATGLPLSKVASGPTTGQYSVSAGGVYTFAAADTAMAVLISYGYTIASLGQKIAMTNQLLGTTPYFQGQFYSTFEGNQVSVKLNKCVSNKLSTATKLEDFNIPEIDFDVLADAAGNVGTWSFGEKS